MLIYSENNVNYCYIHIPKNSGTYLRKTIENNENCKIIKKFWDIKNNLDMAHIPYMFREKFIDIKDINYFAHTRNPYDKLISAYFYKTISASIKMFQSFVINNLPIINFDITFDANIIHYYPQYLFLCDEQFNISNIEITKCEDIFSKTKKYNIKDYYTDDMIKIVNKIYENDFKLLNYSILNI